MGDRFAKIPSLRAFAHRDFRLLWTGAFLSFIGSWVQNVAQGWLVYDLTRDPQKLALVSMLGMLPVTFIGPFAGVFADRLNKRIVLVITQAIFATSAGTLALLTYFGHVQYWHILTCAMVVGLAGAVEVPTRQSIVSRVVPAKDLSAAVPLNALTFNLARVMGPAVGGFLLAQFGPGACYGINSISFFALIFAGLAIRADLRSTQDRGQPMLDLMFEGMRYTMRDKRLKTLFLMECSISLFALFYLSLMPAVARDVLGLGKQGLGLAMTMVGIGAIGALIMVLNLTHKPIKGLLVKISMFGLGTALMILAFSRTEFPAFFALAMAGFFAIIQFNTTNTLFQLLSPERLRGRVLSMHIWALSGVGPIGIYFFGWLAKRASIPIALGTGATLVLISAIVAVLFGDPLREETKLMEDA